MTTGLYRHYKGNLYWLIGVAQHSETGEQMVVYETRYPGVAPTLWVRPAPMWAETVLHNGQTVPRFDFVSPEEQDLQ